MQAIFSIERPWLGAILGGIIGVILPFVLPGDSANLLVLPFLPPVLAIVGAACGAISRRRLWPLFFIVTSSVVGFIFWRTGDWWAYAETGEGRLPKFKAPPTWQLTVSAIVGMFAGAILTGAFLAARWALSSRWQHASGRSP